MVGSAAASRDGTATVDLTDHGTAARLLDGVLSPAGAQRRGSRLRSVHTRGSSSTSAIHEVDVTDAVGRQRTVLYVLHTSTRTVPSGAAVLEVDGVPVHVWRFPDDPYMPGLRRAVDRRRGRRLLDAAGLVDGERPHDPAGIHTRSYRPTRRAVVEVGPADGLPPALYVKVLGGRRAARVRQRTAALVAVHEHLGGHLEVPRVRERDLDDGLVVLDRLDGEPLRQLLRTGRALPPVDDVVDLVARIAAAPAPPGDADPDRYAAIGRHVALLSAVLPAQAAVLERLGAAVGELGGPVTTVHGDLHDGQLLVDDGRLTGVIDLDGAGTGHLAHDVGRLVAHVEVAASTAPAQAATIDPWATRLAQAASALVPPRDLALGAAGAWVGLATGPHRTRRDGWRRAAADRIDHAVAWLERA